MATKMWTRGNSVHLQANTYEAGFFTPTLYSGGFFLWYQLWFNDYKSAWNKSDLSSLHLDFWKCLNTGFTSKQSDGDTVMAPKRWCWFHGNFSMRSFFFFLCSLSDVSGLVTVFPPYSETQMWIYSDSFSSNECPENQEWRCIPAMWIKEHV